MKNIVLHKAESRGNANHGWLNAHHTFSFASYYDPTRVHFGVLRVLNDDIVAGGGGFGMHPHDNMEIVTIPIRGDLEHKDSMGNTAVIRQNDVQIMSAGTGVYHSEYNKNADKDINLLQIWVFPKLKNVTPRYEQITFNPENRINQFQTVVSPDGSGGVFINQDAWFSLGNFEPGTKAEYSIKKEGNGLYVFVIEGSVKIEGELLNRRDGAGISQTDHISFEFAEKTEILLMDLPMSV